jgi:hypothetical protein
LTLPGRRIPSGLSFKGSRYMVNIIQISEKQPDALCLSIKEFFVRNRIGEGRIINIVYNQDKKIYTAFITVDGIRQELGVI